MPRHLEVHTLLGRRCGKVTANPMTICCLVERYLVADTRLRGVTIAMDQVQIVCVILIHQQASELVIDCWTKLHPRFHFKTTGRDLLNKHILCGVCSRKEAALLRGNSQETGPRGEAPMGRILTNP